MEVRPDILQKLLCSVCGEYLCAPVRMKNDGAVLCGRCCDPEGETTLRITPYEQLAEMFVFPCANKTHGCKETLLITEMTEHEDECDYKQFVCPVTESGQCDWSGSRKNILDHCQVEHPDKVLQNPDTIAHQINETNHKSFLLAAFKMLFIVQCKVCIATKNIYHGVRLIGWADFLSKYQYVLEILNKNKTLSISRDVAEQGSMALQEDSSVQVDFNTLLKLGDFKDTIFKIKVGCKCPKCKKFVTESTWPTSFGWCCEDCSPARRQCKFHDRGCSYTDTDIKATAHETYLCKYGIWCEICQKDVLRSRDEHYESAHAKVTYKAGAMWRAPVVNEVKNFIITSDAGNMWCDYVLCETKLLFVVYVRPSLHTEQLSDYICYLHLRNPDTGHTMCESMIFMYDHSVEWEWGLQKHEFLAYVHDNKFDIKIELIKK